MKQFCKLIRRAISRWKGKRQTLRQNAVEIQSEEWKEEQNASSSSVTSTDRSWLLQEKTLFVGCQIPFRNICLPDR